MQDKAEIRNTGACFPAAVADRAPHNTGTHCCIPLHSAVPGEILEGTQ